MIGTLFSITEGHHRGQNFVVVRESDQAADAFDVILIGKGTHHILSSKVLKDEIGVDQVEIMPDTIFNPIQKAFIESLGENTLKQKYESYNRRKQSYVQSSSHPSSSDNV